MEWMKPFASLKALLFLDTLTPPRFTFAWVNPNCQAMKELRFHRPSSVCLA